MKSIIMALSSLLLMVNNAMAQSSNIELLVRIKPDVDDYFEKSNTPILESEKYQKLSTVTPFNKFNVKNIRKAFAWATKTDVVRMLPNGNLYHLPDYTRLLIITLDNNANLDPVLRVLKADKSIMNVEVNGYWRPASVDPLYNKQWNLHNDGSISGGVIGADIHAAEAWGISKGSASVKIGIIGTGIDKTHPDLLGKVLGDNSFTHDANTQAPIPHETQVAGIIGAYGDNNTGIAGIDWNARLISGNPQDNRSTGIIDAITRVTSAGASIINNSWIFENPTNPYVPGSNVPYEIYYALKASYEAGVVIVNSAPQLYEDIDYPSSFGSWMINVSATGNDGLRTYYTLQKYSTDVAAPGGDNTVIPEKGVLSTGLNAGYVYDKGTSFAAPHVSGTAGLLLAVNPSLKNYDIKEIITRTAKNYPSWEPYLGYGQINAYNALNFISSPKTVTHGTATFVKDQSNQQYTIFNSPLLADGYYFADRYKLSFNVNNLHYETPPTVLMPVGYPPSNPLHCYDYTNVTSSTSAASGSSYFYYVIRTLGGAIVGTWIPFNPQQCYTLIGVPSPLTSATISGPATVSGGASNTFAVTPTGGFAPYNYQWWIQITDSGIESIASASNQSTLKDVIADPDAREPGPTWYTFGGNSATVSTTQAQNFSLKCDVTDSQGTTVTSNIFYVTINGATPSAPPAPTYVTLQSSAGSYGPIRVSWTSEGELPDGFEINRLVTPYPGEWEIVATTTYSYWVDPEYIYAPGGGDFNVSYKIRAIKSGLYSDYSTAASVRAEQNGKMSFSASNQDTQLATEIPEQFALNQNYPNPFNPSTTISFDLPKESPVSLKIYDMVGHEIATLVDGYRPAGHYSFSFDASKLSSGLYIYKIQAGEFLAMKKMQVLK